jgi:hypothetical protein
MKNPRKPTLSEIKRHEAEKRIKPRVTGDLNDILNKFKGH